MQSWRIITFIKIIKLIIWNTCFLIIISKFESIFSSKDRFTLIFGDLKQNIKEADLISKVESNFKNSALVNIFSNFYLFLEEIYNLYFRAILYIAFKFCIMNVLKFYFFIEFLIFVLFKHKYTIPYIFIYFGIFLLVMLDYNFFIMNFQYSLTIRSNSKNESLEYNKTPNKADKSIIDWKNNNPDFVSFCYVLLIISSGFLFLHLYHIKVSLWKKCVESGKRVKIFFYFIFVLGNMFIIECLLKIIKSDGKLGILSIFFFLKI